MPKYSSHFFSFTLSSFTHLWIFAIYIKLQFKIIEYLLCMQLYMVKEKSQDYASIASSVSVIKFYCPLSHSYTLKWQFFIFPHFWLSQMFLMSFYQQKFFFPLYCEHWSIQKTISRVFHCHITLSAIYFAFLTFGCIKGSISSFIFYNDGEKPYTKDICILICTIWCYLLWKQIIETKVWEKNKSFFIYFFISIFISFLLSFLCPSLPFFS